MRVTASVTPCHIVYAVGNLLFILLLTPRSVWPILPNLSLIFSFTTYSPEKEALEKKSSWVLPFQRKVQIRCSKFVIPFPFLKGTIPQPLVCSVTLNQKMAPSGLFGF